MKLTIVFLVFFNSIVISQNLVPNPSFEEINDTINRFTQNNLEFNNKVTYWTAANTASPDLLLPNFKEKFIVPPKAHSGSNMIGIQFNHKEWIECLTVKLKKELIPNKTYYVEFWIRKSYCISPSMNKDEFMNDNFGILFSSENLISSNGKMLNGTPQVKVNTDQLITYKEWVKVSKYFTPKSRYDKFYLGQFQKEGEEPNTKMGYYVIDDILVEELKDHTQLKEDTELSIGSIIPLDLIHFKTGTTELKDEKSYQSLKNLSNYLSQNPSIRIRINGHTDSDGNKKSNKILSESRAKFIAQNIISNGINKNRIEWKGFGELNPIADNNTEKGKSKNRRVECEIIE